MPDLIEYEGGDILANLDDRTITGLLVPFNELGHTNAGRFMVEAGALALPSDPSVIGLNTDHERSQPVGRGTRVWQQAEGIFATFRVAETPEGDAALADALDPNGKRRRLSGEFHTSIKAGKAVPGSGRLWGAALVEMGAFPSAMVLAADTTTSSSQYVTEYTDEAGVTWRRVEETVTTTTTEVAAPVDNTEGDTPVTDTAEVAASVAAVPGTAGAPNATAARTASRQPDSAMILAAVRALRTNPADHGAVQVLAAIGDIPMTGANALPAAGVLQPNWLGPLFQGVPYVREYITLCNLGTDITAGGKAGFRTFRGTAGAPGDAPFDGTWAGFPSQINGYQGSTDVLRSTLAKFAVGNAIDRSLFDLPGGSEVVAAFLQLVIEDYLVWSDEGARTTIISQAVPVAAATAKYPNNYPAALGQLIQGILAVKKKKSDKRRDVPTFAIANDTAFEQLAYAAGGEQNLPAFVNLALSTSGHGTVDGDVTVVNGDTGISGTASVVVGASQGIDFDELPGGPLVIDAMELARGGIDKATHGYLQTFVRRPQAFAHVGTPDAWAQGVVGVAQLIKVGAGILRATVGGTTSNAAPALPGAVGGTVVDGGVTWKRIA